MNKRARFSCFFMLVPRNWRAIIRKMFLNVNRCKKQLVAQDYEVNKKCGIKKHAAILKLH
jgi:hypothetical protein